VASAPLCALRDVPYLAGVCRSGGLLPPAQPSFDDGGAMTLHIELEQEADGRWLAEVSALPGVVAYGVTQTDAIAKVQAVALRVLADRLDHGEAVPEYLNVIFRAA
jgi:predicted RNase H-like HicB family nuclease